MALKIQLRDDHSHYDRMAETAGITRDQAALLAAEAKIGGSWNAIAKIGADGSATWRGQTIGSEAWTRMQDYAEQHQVLDLWSRVSDASRRYTTATGGSEAASLDESLTANLTDMRSFQERAALSRQESDTWSEQAARVRSQAQTIDRDLGQPFFAWLSERTGADGRAIGAAGALRLASPQTAEDAEQLREYAAAFVAETVPPPAGPDPATVGGKADYEAAAGDLRGAYARETGAAYTGWGDGVRGRAQAAGAPLPGEIEAAARNERAGTNAGMTVKETAREARQSAVTQDIADGRAGVAAETGKPFARHATENLPFAGGWLAGKLFGSAQNAAPDAADGDTAPGGRPDRGGRGEDAP